MRVSPLSLIASLFLVLAACATPITREALLERRDAVDAFLADAVDHPSFAYRLGVPQERCVDIDPELELCQWRVSNRHSGWEPLAKAIGTRDQVNVICWLPKTGESRAAGSCLVFPRRTNRGQYVSSDAGTATKKGQRDARAMFDSARDVVSLSHVIGAIPDLCRPMTADEQMCVWRASGSTYGHGTLVAYAGAGKGDRMRVTCKLPVYEAPRGEGSCRVEVGS